MLARAVLCLCLLVTTARADMPPEPEKGSRFLTRSVAVDGSALPPGQVLCYVNSKKFGGIGESFSVSPLVSPLELGLGNNLLYLFVLPRADANGKYKARELLARGTKPALLDAPPMEEVPESDPRVKVTRNVKITNLDPLRIEHSEDVLLGKSNEAVCRRPALDDTQLEEGLDPCDPQAKQKKLRTFWRQNKLVVFGAGGLVLVGVMLAVGRRFLKKRS